MDEEITSIIDEAAETKPETKFEIVETEYEPITKPAPTLGPGSFSPESATELQKIAESFLASLAGARSAVNRLLSAAAGRGEIPEGCSVEIELDGTEIRFAILPPAKKMEIVEASVNGGPVDPAASDVTPIPGTTTPGGNE